MRLACAHLGVLVSGLVDNDQVNVQLLGNGLFDPA
jgi:hypothetical protein